MPTTQTTAKRQKAAPSGRSTRRYLLSVAKNRTTRHNAVAYRSPFGGCRPTPQPDP